VKLELPQASVIIALVLSTFLEWFAAHFIGHKG